jgi:hypothetical protein
LDGRAWTVFIWLWIGTSGRMMWTRWWNFDCLLLKKDSAPWNQWVLVQSGQLSWSGLRGRTGNSESNYTSEWFTARLWHLHAMGLTDPIMKR